MPKEQQSSLPAATSKPIAKKRKTKLELGDKVFEPTENDILYGRGGRTNTHPGNIRYRDKVLELKDEYKLLTKKEKKERKKFTDAGGQDHEERETLFLDEGQGRIVVRSER